MSYSIIYDKQFIKADIDGTTMYIPMLLAGSSNCYDVNGGRSRDWFATRAYSDNAMATEKELIEGVYDQLNRVKPSSITETREDVANSLGYYLGLAIGTANTRKTTFKKLKSMLITGMKKAVTVEQFSEYGTLYIRDDNGKNSFVGTTEKLVELFKSGNVHGATASACNSIASRLRKKHFQNPIREKKEKKITKVYKIMVGNHLGYFKKETSRQVRYDMYGKEFISRSKAMNKIKHMEAKNYPVKFKLVEIDVDKVILI